MRFHRQTLLLYANEPTNQPNKKKIQKWIFYD